MNADVTQLLSAARLAADRAADFLRGQEGRLGPDSWGVKRPADFVTEIDLAANKVGIFGKLSKLNTPLRGGDRVEIYRTLIADPKEVRKQRAAQGKAMKKGGGDDKTEAVES